MSDQMTASGLHLTDTTRRAHAVALRSLESMSKPLPARENSEVLLRSVSSVPILEGHAGALAVALGYGE